MVVGGVGGAIVNTIRRPPLAVRRACLRRRAFYASPCQATAPSLERFTHRAHSAGPLRPEVELTPSKVRKSKPMFHRCSMLFQDDLGLENGGKYRAKPSTGAFRDAPGARLPGDAVWGCILEVFWDLPNPENRAPATMRAQLRLNTLTAPGGPKSTPFWSKIEAKSLPGAVHLASKAVFHTAAITVLVSTPFF